MKRLLVAWVCLASCNAFALTTADQGHVDTVWTNGGLWAFTLQEGMANAIADRACRLEYFATDRDDVVKLVLFAKQNDLQIRVNSRRCLSTTGAGAGDFHRVEAVETIE